MERPEAPRRRPRPGYAAVTSTIALIAACSGAAVAVAPHLAPDSVASRHLQAEAVRAAHIAPETVTGRHIAQGAVDDSRLRGKVRRVRGPLPVGTPAGGRIQDLGDHRLRILPFAGRMASPATYPGFPGIANPGGCSGHGFDIVCAPSNATIRTTDVAPAQCPDGTVLQYGGVAVSGPGTADGAFTAGGAPRSGTWTVTAAAGAVTVNQTTQTVTAQATFTARFASPAGPFGGYSGAGGAWVPPARAATRAAPAVTGPAGAVPDVGVQAIAYCLAVVSD